MLRCVNPPPCMWQPRLAQFMSKFGSVQVGLEASSCHKAPARLNAARRKPGGLLSYLADAVAEQGAPFKLLASVYAKHSWIHNHLTRAANSFRPGSRGFRTRAGNSLVSTLGGANWDMRPRAASQSSPREAAGLVGPIFSAQPGCEVEHPRCSLPGPISLDYDIRDKARRTQFVTPIPALVRRTGYCSVRSGPDCQSSAERVANLTFS